MARAVKVTQAGAGYTVVQYDDGSVVRYDGSRNWRNNNPGNIEYGPFARSMGAIGTDGRFAVFPDYQTGRAAKQRLLFNSKGYAGKTIAQAINRYAPPVENNTKAYYNNIAKAAGVSSNTKLSALSTAQRSKLLDAMERVEGFKVGRSSSVKGNIPQGVMGGAAGSNASVAALPDLPVDLPALPKANQYKAQVPLREDPAPSVFSLQGSGMRDSLPLEASLQQARLPTPKTFRGIPKSPPETTQPSALATLGALPQARPDTYQTRVDIDPGFVGMQPRNPAMGGTNMALNVPKSPAMGGANTYTGMQAKSPGMGGTNMALGQSVTPRQQFSLGPVAPEANQATLPTLGAQQVAKSVSPGMAVVGKTTQPEERNFLGGLFEKEEKAPEFDAYGVNQNKTDKGKNWLDKQTGQNTTKNLKDGLKRAMIGGVIAGPAGALAGLGYHAYKRGGLQMPNMSSLSGLKNRFQSGGWESPATGWNYAADTPISRGIQAAQASGNRGDFWNYNTDEGHDGHIATMAYDRENGIGQKSFGDRLSETLDDIFG